MNAMLEGMLFRGMKIPPINNRGNLIKFMRTIISEVMSVGFADTSSPSTEPRKPISIIPMKIIRNENGDETNTGKNIMKIMAMIEVMIIE